MEIVISNNSMCFPRVVTSRALSTHRDDRFPEEEVQCGRCCNVSLCSSNVPPGVSIIEDEQMVVDETTNELFDNCCSQYFKDKNKKYLFTRSKVNQLSGKGTIGSKLYPIMLGDTCTDIILGEVIVNPCLTTNERTRQTLKFRALFFFFSPSATRFLLDRGPTGLAFLPFPAFSPSGNPWYISHDPKTNKLNGLLSFPRRLGGLSVNASFPPS